jgi:hypothetical protein
MFRFHRVLIGYAVAIPLALFLGYLVATPDMASAAVVGMVLFFMALPLLIQWNHFLLIFFWNSAFIAGFLPGSLQLWTIFAALTFGMGVVHKVMGHKSFLRAPELTKPILLLSTVVILTAKIRGGLGMRVLGSESFGGKNYLYILAAVVGYFALTSQAISISKGARAVKWYFLSGLTFGMTNLVYVLGPTFYFLFYFVSLDFVYGQAAADFTGDVVKRLGGLGPSATGLVCFILARWGIRGVVDWTKPWRLLLFLASMAAGLLSGFRSQIAFLGLLLVMQFMVEGLWKTYLMPVVAVLGVLCLTPILLFADKMPASVQRSMAFLPVNIDPGVRLEAMNSSEWRFQMWRAVLPEVPKYLFIGKGYAIDPVDLYLTEQASHSGLLSGYEGAMLAGDYHNGPLSVLMPFGAFGAIAFLWLLGAGIKVLAGNRRYGDPRLKSINDFFLSYFLTQCLSFCFVFGALNSQLSVFLGILGLSVSVNGGVCRMKAPRAKPVPASATATAMLEPA